MSHQILETLFDSPVKVKLFKLFLRNPDRFFLQKEIVSRTQSDSRIVSDQLEALSLIGFLRKKTVNGKRNSKAAGVYFAANPEFDFYRELSSLVLKSIPASKEKILNKVQKLGRIKLLLLAGIFLNTENSRIDMFLVGDLISHKKLDVLLKDLEAEVGKELAFAVMSTKEFHYRFHMFDRFVHDILEKPNEKLINKLRI